MTALDYATAGMMSLAVLVFFFVCAVASLGSPNRTAKTARYASSRAYTPRPVSRPSIVFHGGPWSGVTDIYTNNRWLVGPTKKLWFASNFDVAKSYAKFKGPGAVVELRVDPSVELRLEGNGVYTAPVPHSQDDRYYRIAGIVPTRILDPDNRQQLLP